MSPRAVCVAAAHACALVLASGLGACGALAPVPSGPSDAPAPARRAALVVEVTDFMNALPKRLGRDGPAAWLDHFAEDDRFSMASDGAVAFADRDEAAAMLADFAPTIATMELVWEQLRVDILSEDVALVVTPYRERLVTTAGEELSFAGCFSGVAVRTPVGWRLLHLHWSSPVAGDRPGS